ncbi:MAG: alpha/beta hydrolase fold domain-containing protein [Lachnospiraceae bacterium]|nr:alpha/beta hydrolase fold domain-containing protein [Lachnospiraceae bacterium]
MRKYYTIKSKKIFVEESEMELFILHPTINAKPKERTPGILWIHGGGYVTGMAQMIYMSRAMDLVKKYGAVVITPEYRLSKKAPYPAALHDCYAALKYLKEHADELGINSSQIMVGGESAGGGLTAALCMYARDKAEVNIFIDRKIKKLYDIDSRVSHDYLRYDHI